MTESFENLLVATAFHSLSVASNWRSGNERSLHRMAAFQNSLSPMEDSMPRAQPKTSRTDTGWRVRSRRSTNTVA